MKQSQSRPACSRQTGRSRPVGSKEQQKRAKPKAGIQQSQSRPACSKQSDRLHVNRNMQVAKQALVTQKQVSIQAERSSRKALSTKQESSHRAGQQTDRQVGSNRQQL
jgi:hypothetical protein